MRFIWVNFSPLTSADLDSAAKQGIFCPCPRFYWHKTDGETCLAPWLDIKEVFRWRPFIKLGCPCSWKKWCYMTSLVRCVSLDLTDSRLGLDLSSTLIVSTEVVMQKCWITISSLNSNPWAGKECPVSPQMSFACSFVFKTQIYFAMVHFHFGYMSRPLLDTSDGLRFNNPLLDFSAHEHY